MTWYKILNKDGSPIDGSKEIWSLPEGKKDGEICKFYSKSRELLKNHWILHSPAIGATWLVNNPNLVYKLDYEYEIFAARIFSKPLYEKDGFIWIDKVQLIRKATNHELRRFNIHRAFKYLTVH